MTGSTESGKRGSLNIVVNPRLGRRFKLARTVWKSRDGDESVDGVFPLKVPTGVPTGRSFGRTSTALRASCLICSGDSGSGAVVNPSIEELREWRPSVDAVPDRRFDGVRHCAYGRREVMLT
jgi:hypothetical protein